MGVEKEDGYRKRILFVGEASCLNTGFSTYYRELLPRLAATNKYVIAEFGSYIKQSDPRIKDFVKDRWQFYGNEPETQEEIQAYQQQDPAQPGQNTNQFGRWKFEKVLADFRPDIVVDIRDWWMVSFQERSPFRKYFEWLLMPTVDSIPQREEWIQTYNGATYVMAYSDFGIDSLRKSSPKLEVRFAPKDKPELLGLSKRPGKLHPVPMRPGVDLKTFYPRTNEEKGLLKQKWGIKPDVPIVVLVQRNQARKRISEVITSFAKMKDMYPDNETVQKAILVMHTAWPDNAMSIDFPRAVARIQQGYHGTPVQRKGIMREVCSTYMCHNPQCGDVFIAPSILLRQSDTIQCPKCGQRSVRTPNTGKGITREQLSEVYGMADMMVQMSIAEGCGMPVQEAKACGVPTLVTDYAAISEKGKVPDYDHINKATYSVHKGGQTMDVAYLYEEPETTCWRAMTSIDDCAHKMAKMLSDEKRLAEMSKEARECVEEHYDWDKNWKNWEFVLDHMTPLDRDKTWDKPQSLIDIDQSMFPDSGSDEDFIVWCYTKLLGYKTAADIDEEGRSVWLRKLSVEGSNGIPRQQTRGEIMQYFRQQAESLNNIEKMRTGPNKTVETVEEDNTDTFEGMIV